MLAGWDNDARVDLKGLAEPVPCAVQRDADEIAVFPVPVVVDVKIGVLKAAVEIVVAGVGEVRQDLAETPATDPLLPECFLEADEEPSIAVLILEKAHLGIEVLSGFAVLESNPVATVIKLRVGVVGVIAAAEPGGFGRASDPTAVRLTNIAPMPDRLGSSRLTRITEKLLPAWERTSSVCMFSTPTL
jgi:hypothetical protein